MLIRSMHRNRYRIATGPARAEWRRTCHDRRQADPGRAVRADPLTAPGRKEERFRRPLEVYELKRQTAHAKERLDLACVRANLPEWPNAITASFEPEGPIPGPRPQRIHRRLRHG